MPLEVGGALRLRLEAVGRKQRSEDRDRRSEVRGQGTEIFLWERLLAAILQFERF